MPWHAGVSCAMPFIADGVHIRMADTTKEDLDLNITLTGITAVKAKGGERTGGSVSGVGFGFHKELSSEVIRVIQSRRLG